MAFCRTEDSLRNYAVSALSCLLLLSIVLSLAGCIAHAPGNGGGGGKQIAVAVASSPASPASVSVSTSTPSTVQYTATVTGTSNQAVTWTLAADPDATTVCTASGSALGTIATTGTNTMTYTAPAGPLPMSPCGVAVTATSNEDNVTTGQALVNIHVVVTVSPATDTIGQGANLQLAATVIGASSADQNVDWSAACGQCTGQQTAGIVDPKNPGLYIAPGIESGINTLQAAISATSTFDTQQSGTATITVNKSDPLGTATPATAAAAQMTCPSSIGGVSGATCYQLNVACDAIADWTVYLKVNPTTGTPIGTVILGTGGGGTSLYDNDPNFIGESFNGGQTIVQDLLNPGVGMPGYTTVQVSFGAPFNNAASVENGWLQGPGGVRRLACRYATVADWVYKNIHNSNTAAPYCATGNSGGSGAIAYAVSEYALASEFSLIELTSGPVMTLLNQGCNLCSQYSGSDPCPGIPPQPMCFTASGGTGSTSAIIDKAYQAAGHTTPTLCTDGVNGIGNNKNFSRFLSDSIEDDPGVTPALPIGLSTAVNVLFGASDTSNAVPQGEQWWNAVGPTRLLTPICVPGTPHAIPSTPAGANQIVSDIQSQCVLH